MLYYVTGYRKKVVLENLRKSFPNKSEAEINRLCKDFYHYLCDLLLETFKTLTITKKTMLRRCTFTNESKVLFDKLAQEKKSIVLVMGHLGNWEWAGNSFSMLCKQQLYVIYHPLTNKHFDSLIYNMRMRFGTKLIAMRNTYRDMVANRHEVNATAFIADQTPSPEGAYWTTFLNQDTPVFKGTEKIAQKLNFPIVYACVKRVKRGFYEIHAKMLVENPAGTKEGEISELHTRQLEGDIIAQPEVWLWSHRRWKHKKPVA
jgi:KDO2-lipid IV(A) lauroyltransferase